METFQKSFRCFLLEIPRDFYGVHAITVANVPTATTLRISEKGSQRMLEVLKDAVKHPRATWVSRGW